MATEYNGALKNERRKRGNEKCRAVYNGAVASQPANCIDRLDSFLLFLKQGENYFFYVVFSFQKKD